MKNADLCTPLKKQMHFALRLDSRDIFMFHDLLTKRQRELGMMLTRSAVMRKLIHDAWKAEGLAVNL